MDLTRVDSSHSLLSCGDTDTIAETASVAAKSETTTLRPSSRVSTYKPPHVSYSRGTIGSFTSSRLFAGISGLVRRVMSVFRGDETTSEQSERHEKDISSPIDFLTAEGLDRLSDLLFQHGILDDRRQRIDARKFHQTSLNISNPTNLEAVLGVLEGYQLPSLATLHADIIDLHYRDLSHVTAFIEKLSSLTNVYLDFCHEHLDDPGWVEETTPNLANFLDVLSTKNCQALCLQGSRRLPVPTCLLSRESERLEAKGKAFLSPVERIHGIQPITSLRTLDIQIPLMLTPPWHDWTTRTINLSPIDSLHLNPTIPIQMSSILPAIATKSFQTFSIQGVTFPDLMDFLSRQSIINVICPVYLTHDVFSELNGVGASDLVHSGSFPRDGFILPLQSLHAPAEFISRFLELIDTSRRPALHSFIISQGYLHSLRNHDPCDSESLALKKAIQAIKSIPIPNTELECTFSCVYCLTSFLRSACDQEKSLMTKPPPSSVTRIKLHLHGPECCPYPQIETILAEWLSSFPSLIEFKLRLLWNSSTWFASTSSCEQELLKAVQAKCPNLRSVVVGSTRGGCSHAAY
ncbi:hypothetical protein JAAARDRAFT_199381 [Jaapia argillacea MUCL 33604]|uniref:F-box domain-containing protein n=1 Tax=Jaapia argillacea MUCL 33604 TaxID=933084 RepID=A0A067P8R7_9AGAM|nr:hypothetical protein JAAARDRAFT_199381 [Jaapia argillacea MUCL 33604]